jgi:hypothetical protein
VSDRISHIVDQLRSLTSEFSVTHRVSVAVSDDNLEEVLRLIAQCEAVWRVHIAAMHVSGEELQLLRMHRGIECLILQVADGIDDASCVTFSPLPALRELWLCSEKCFGDEALKHVSRCRSLSVLKMEGMLRATGTGLSRLERLESLVQLDLPDLTRDQGFPEKLPSERLQHLTASGKAVTDEAMSVIGRLTTLTCLKLYKSDLSERGLFEVGRLKRLREFTLERVMHFERGVS